MNILKKYHRLDLNIIIPLLFVLLYILPLLWYGEGSYVLIHDNLDSNIIWSKVLAESGKMFSASDAIIPNIMSGLPRNLYGSEFELMNWLYYFFDSFTAYVINQVLMRLVAFIGMFLLLKNYFLKDNYVGWIAAGVALTFSLLPFWPFGGLSVAGQPLALYAFLNFREGKHGIKDWLIVSLVPFYASLVLSFSFFITAILILWLYDWVSSKKINVPFLLAIMLMSGVFLLVEYRLVYSMFFDSSFVSHRSDGDLTGYGLIESIRRSWIMFRFGQYHAHSLHQYLISLSAVMALSVALAKSLRVRIFIVLILIIAATSGFYGLWGFSIFVPLRENIGVLSSFQFTRFHFLNPLLWYLVFALCLKILYVHIPKYGRIIVISFIFLQSLFLFYNHDQVQERKGPNYQEFFSEQLFSEIERFIDEPKEDIRVVSIGMHPSVSQYSGFYTLDAYMANYPLSYKEEFREVIELELDKNAKLKSYYDNWGNRCYVFIDELDGNYMVTKDLNKQVANLELNNVKLYEMGGRYIFSAAEVLNYADNNLELLQVFESDDSPWRIHLYEVIEPLNMY